MCACRWDVCIGPPRSTDSYLKRPAIISAAEITGADRHSSRLRLSVRERVPRGSLRGVPHQVHRPSPTSFRLLGDKRGRAGAMKRPACRSFPAGRAGRQRGEGRRRSRGTSGCPSSSRPSPAAAGRGMRVHPRHEGAQQGAQDGAAGTEAASASSDVYIFEKYVRTRVTSSFRCSAIITAPVVHLGEREMLDPAAPPESSWKRVPRLP